jgi:regulator of sigma E protease
MEAIHNLPAFIGVLGVIIFVHEFGHFITAKAFGMRVFIFSFGFGRRLFGFKWGGTDCRVSLIPLGGYVKLEGEPGDAFSEEGPTDVRVLDDGTIVRVDSPHYFLNRPRWQRFLVYVAGPLMNVVLTLSGFTWLFMVGWRPDPVLQEAALIGTIEPGSPAEQAGLLPGDEITAIDGTPTENWEEAQIAIQLRPEREIALQLRRGAERRELTLRTRSEGPLKAGGIGVAPLVRIGGVSAGLPAEAAGMLPGDGIVAIDGALIRSPDDVIRAVRGAPGPTLALRFHRDGAFREVQLAPQGGRIGVEFSGGGPPLPLLSALRRSVDQTWRSTVQIFAMLRDLVTARVSPRAGLTGPIGIADLAGEAARTSPRAVLFVITMISLSVGILNLVPLAPLDGGHLAILVAEGVVRRDFSATVKAWIMNAGVVVLFLLIGLVIYSDLSKTRLLGKYLP